MCDDRGCSDKNHTSTFSFTTDNFYIAILTPFFHIQSQVWYHIRLAPELKFLVDKKIFFTSWIKYIYECDEKETADEVNITKFR